MDTNEQFQHNFQHPFSIRQEGGPNHTTGIPWHPPWFGSIGSPLPTR